MLTARYARTQDDDVPCEHPRIKAYVERTLPTENMIFYLAETKPSKGDLLQAYKILLGQLTQDGGWYRLASRSHKCVGCPFDYCLCEDPELDALIREKLQQDSRELEQVVS